MGVTVAFRVQFHTTANARSVQSDVVEASRTHPTPYGSARDLPSVIEMREMLAGMKLLTRVVARDQRSGLIELEGEMNALSDLVDRFYTILGARHWLFTDHLPVSAIEALLQEAATGELAESGLVQIIADRVRGPYWQMGLFGHESLRARHANFERARQHYLDEQWDSCALVLITVMDGFVNDVEPANRRGLHVRDPEEMVAWDSLVGHHKGLSAVMPVFLKSCKRRRDEEVFELHRHGIVHGTILNYNNQVVATKAWNMLSAVIDWADAKKKAAEPPEPKPTWRTTWDLLVERAERERYRKDFKPWKMAVDNSLFAGLEIVQTATTFLTSWQAGRWGLVAEALPSIGLEPKSSLGKQAAQAKRIYEHTRLVDFQINNVSFPQVGVAVIDGTATIGDRTGPLEIRWVYETGDRRVGNPDNEGGRWVLAVYPPHTFIKDER